MKHFKTAPLETDGVSELKSPCADGMLSGTVGCRDTVPKHSRVLISSTSKLSKSTESLGWVSTSATALQVLAGGFRAVETTLREVAALGWPGLGSADGAPRTGWGEMAVWDADGVSACDGGCEGG